MDISLCLTSQVFRWWIFLFALLVSSILGKSWNISQGAQSAKRGIPLKNLKLWRSNASRWPRKEEIAKEGKKTMKNLWDQLFDVFTKTHCNIWTSMEYKYIVYSIVAFTDLNMCRKPNNCYRLNCDHKWTGKLYKLPSFFFICMNSSKNDRFFKICFMNKKVEEIFGSIFIICLLKEKNWRYDLGAFS